jgi:hypothetical protein
MSMVNQPSTPPQFLQAPFCGVVTFSWIHLAYSNSTNHHFTAVWKDNDTHAEF